MTSLLVSVRSADDAEAALRGGADWIDLKEPLRGPLGAVDAGVARDLAMIVAGRAPLTAAAGELVDWPRSPSHSLLNVGDIHLLKLGLKDCGHMDWRRAWNVARLQIVAAGKQLVPVIYADHDAAGSPCPAEIVEHAAMSSCPWVLIDTFDKSAGSLSDYLNDFALRELLLHIRAVGKRSVVAGRLRPSTIAALPLDLIDVVGVRGAACGGDRDGVVRSELVAELQAVIAAMRRDLHRSHAVFFDSPEIA